jgi:hypothetical protein
MPDYTKGKIYTIRCKYDTTLIYVGSTINPLYKRLGHHKGDALQEKRKSKVYTTINNDWDNWYIELYELYPCVNVEELRKREGEIIRLISTLNERVAGRTDQEYRLENAEQIKKDKKEYYDANKEKILDEQKEYRLKNVDKIKEQKKEYRLEHTDKIKGKKKEYYDTNKEKILEKMKQSYSDNPEKKLKSTTEYRENNKEKIKERKSEKIPCDKCGEIGTNSHMSRHKQTKKCMNFTPQ